MKSMRCLTAACLLVSHVAIAGNAACWGDDRRQDISCRALTENFLLSMRGATKDQVQKAMGVLGRPIDDGLHFISNNSEGSRFGSGDVNFMFNSDGQVAVIYGLLDLPNETGTAEFIWNREKLPSGCSDLPHSKMNRCTP
jgi:hypothetical protein